MKFFKYTLVVVAIWISGGARADQNRAVLTAYTETSKYVSSSFNFVTMSQNPDETRNRIQILYQPNNEIVTETVVGDLGAIVDLGEKSCKALPYEAVKGPYPGKGHGGYPYIEDRKEDPMFWLTYSPAWSILSKNRSSRITPAVGHCYLTHLAGHDGNTVAMFRVTGIIPGQFMVIEEMELFLAPNK